MRKVLVFSVLLLLGLVGSQVIDPLTGDHSSSVRHVVLFLTMAALAFIMIHVGYEFEIDKRDLRGYGWDYVVAFTAASFPWILVTVYFLWVMLPDGSFSSWPAWKETLLAGRFAAPTSAGVLFSMLAAAGLSSSWLFRKARVLAIFDDLDTVLLMIPLKMLMVGLAWQLGLVVILMIGLLLIAYRWLHRIPLPVSWPWVLGYALSITIVSEIAHLSSKLVDDSVPIHIEVLLPAFVLGCVLRRPPGANPHSDDDREGHQEGPESPEEQKVSTVVSAVFMVLVGLSMPSLVAASAPGPTGPANAGMVEGVTIAAPPMGWSEILLHVLAVTVISNLGKMYPAFCYRDQAHWRERLALAVGMWPRGEVGAGVLVISIGYGIGGPILTVAVLSLAVNLVLTGVFILIVKRLISGVPRAERGAVVMAG